MSLWETLTIAVALGTDAFSVAVVCGVQQYSRKDIIKISLVIAVFHIIMPLTGLYGAQFIQDLIYHFFKFNGKIEVILNYVGSGLLMIIGFYMLIEKHLNKEEELCNFKITGWGLFILAFSVSIDSLSVGISLGMLGYINSLLVIVIGITAGLMMAIGLVSGSWLGDYFGDKAQMLGGIALIFLGIHFSGLL